MFDAKSVSLLLLAAIALQLSNAANTAFNNSKYILTAINTQCDGISLDPSGTAAWLGCFKTGVTNDRPTLIKVDKQRNILSSWIYEGAGFAYTKDIFASSSGIYMVGNTNGGMNSVGLSAGNGINMEDYFVIKINPVDGSVIWTTINGTPNADIVYGVWEDQGTGLVFIAGARNFTVNSQPWSSPSSSFVGCLNGTNGKVIWETSLAGSTQSNWARRVVTLGGFVVTAGIGMGWTGYLGKLSLNGTVVGFSQNSIFSDWKAVIPFTDQLLVAGKQDITTSNQNFRMFAVDLNLVVQASPLVGFGSSAEDCFYDIAYNPVTKQIAAVGDTYGSLAGFNLTGSKNAVIAMFDFDGTQLWTLQETRAEYSAGLISWPDGALMFLYRGATQYLGTYEGALNDVTAVSSTFASATLGVAPVATPAVQAVINVINGVTATSMISIQYGIITSSTENPASDTNTTGQVSALVTTLLYFSIAAGACIILLVWFVFVMMRRRRAPKNTTMDMANDNPSQLSTSHTDPSSLLKSSTNYSITQAGATLVNGSGEISIPSFLKKTAGFDFIIGSEVIATGGSGKIVECKANDIEMLDRTRGAPLVAKITANNIGAISSSTASGFYQEISLMWLFRDHPNFAKLYAYCEEPVLIVMEYYVYGDLQRFIHGNGKAAEQFTYSKMVILSLLKQWSGGITYMHNLNVSNNDVKPLNVLLNVVGGSLKALITDLGISRITKGAVTVDNFQANKINGASLSYASPEALFALKTRAILSDDILKAGDVYSLGISACQMLKRVSVWEGRN